MEMERTEDLQATFCATLVDEWARSGMSKAIVCPGSRSTPLALALAQSEMFDVHVVLDERSGAFMALGIGLADAQPAVLLTTSGTAVTHLLGAVAEADLSSVPMVVCTADRPPELHGVGAPQTIEQVGIFGARIRWAANPGVPVATTRSTWRSLASRAVLGATGGYGGRPGPVHLNLAFREPLVGIAGELPPGRSVGPWHHALTEATDAGLAVAEVRHLAMGDRGVFVVGAGIGDPEAVHDLAARLGWPVLADARSGARLDRRTTVASADAILRDPETAARLRPEVVIRLGAPWASKVVNQWLATSRAEQVLVDVNGAWWDPDRTAEFVWRGRPDAFCRAEEWADASAAPPDWLEAWTTAENVAQAMMDVALSGISGRLDDPTIARVLTREMPSGSILVTAASMPMREVEWYGVRRDGLRVLANRGANGIDGVTSTVLGVAAADASVFVVGLLGDLAFLHDSTALLTAAGGRIDALLVVVDNHGGAIFEFLPQAASLDRARFEQLFGTPQHADLPALAAAYGLAVTEVSSVAELKAAIKKYAYESGTRMIHARTDRTKTVAVHEGLHTEIRSAVAEALQEYDLE